ncbi:MAG: hypothetical protein ACJAYC_003324 [Halieaceae bacterium]|jgi:hypothetical protein
MRRVWTCIFVPLLAACAGSGPTTTLTTQCTSPRPQVCTMEYAPVCAIQTGGGRGDYSSACNACADDKVTGYLNGPCSGPGGAG